MSGNANGIHVSNEGITDASFSSVFSRSTFSSSLIMSSSPPNFLFPAAFDEHHPENGPAVLFASEDNGALFWTVSENGEHIAPPSVDLPHGHNVDLNLKLEPELDIYSTDDARGAERKEEFAMELKWHGESAAPADTVTAWHPSGDLMEIILEDSTGFGFGIRLDDDVYVEANKESALNVFGVPTFISPLTRQSGQPLSLREDLPPDNLETYRWRGDMGILDRLAYRSADAVPRNWKMTTLDTARIEARNVELRLAWEAHSTNSTSSQPQGITHEEGQETSNNGGMINFIVPSVQSPELTGPIPKKKR
jgi:hypothetical protein